MRVFLYYLFRTFPSIEEAARDASRRIYEEYLDAQPEKPAPVSRIRVEHLDGEPDDIP